MNALIVKVNKTQNIQSSFTMAQTNSYLKEGIFTKKRKRTNSCLYIKFAVKGYGEKNRTKCEYHLSPRSTFLILVIRKKIFISQI
ncbi:hypothetical protein GCM10011346_22580 [Oceanobacillus neutriphilus]|uniref:Uncharacterized protein n=1 Tax=Oceanobacillus neutriphilus TaxID=531815 RepID=A0ABQ2NV23_9BACI|nr:hypothetical protein GCM10011346_22580 [Oceanobacillus neutriphilus]